MLDLFQICTLLAGNVPLIDFFRQVNKISSIFIKHQIEMESQMPTLSVSPQIGTPASIIQQPGVALPRRSQDICYQLRWSVVGFQEIVYIVF